MSGFLGDFTDDLGLTDSGAGEKAAKRAGQAIAAGSEEAKSLLSPGYAEARADLQRGRSSAGQNYVMGADRYLEDITSGLGAATGALDFGRDASLANLTGAAGLSREALSGSMGLGRDALASGRDASLGALGAGRDASVGALQPLSDAALSSLGRLQSGSTATGYAANIDRLRSGGAFDPLIAENQRNLEAQLAAQGLTRSGSGITDMSQIPIETLMGIESNLYGRTGDIYQSGLPAISNIAQLESQYGRDVSGLESQYGANLANYERGYGQDLANLEMGLGQGQAGINASFAPMMADLQYGYGQQAGATRQGLQNTLGLGRENLASNLAQLNIGEAQDLANIATGQSGAQSSAILAGAQAEAADRAALGNITGSIGGLVAAASDIRLKENVTPIGKVGPLTIYSWDWNEEGMRIAGDNPTTGFIAQEVAEHYPQHIHRIEKYMAVDYSGVESELELEKCQH